MIGRAGLEPAIPEGDGFTVRRLLQFAYLPLLRDGGLTSGPTDP